MPTIIGTNSPDLLRGTVKPDTMIGHAGDDQLFGLGANDRLNGGLGNDLLDGGVGNDTADYSNIAIDGTNYIGASMGITVSLNLALVGAQNTGGAGIDRLVSIENLIGSNFKDILTGNGANNRLDGEGGSDTLNGLGGNDILNGGAGADTMNGGDHDDLYIVDNLDDVAVETFNNALGGVDLVQSSVSHTISFGIENLTLTGGGNIQGKGNASNNIINGNNGNNFLSGQAGNDTLNGSAGNDTLHGDHGNDTLIGGTGKDVLTGGGGAFVFDTFDYNAISESLPGAANFDSITDFYGRGAFIGDQIDLTTIDANALLAGDQAFRFIGSAAFTAAGQLRYTGGILSGSTDADAAAEFQIQLVGAPALSVGPFPGTDILL